jgi:hypothetical protein
MGSLSRLFQAEVMAILMGTALRLFYNPTHALTYTYTSYLQTRF